MSGNVEENEAGRTTEIVGPTSEEDAVEEPAVVTISVNEEEEKRFPADYVILCRGVSGQVIRYKTHKLQLMHGSGFYRDMFAACGSKTTEGDGRSEDLEEVEMTDHHHYVYVLLLSLYLEGKTFRSKLEQGSSETSEQYSR